MPESDARSVGMAVSGWVFRTPQVPKLKETDGDFPALGGLK